MQNNSPSCTIHETLNLLSGKWTMPLLWSMCVEPKGFNQLSRELSGISPRVLSERLKELVEYELVKKEVFATNPPTVSYSLTNKGLSLKPIVQSLHVWSEDHTLVEKTP
jgi:DNA-binding HxlR family transcriptional regulator